MTTLPQRLEGQLLSGIVVAAAALISSTASHAASTVAKTKYPIVLVHGMAGFDSVVGIDYFYQVPAELRKTARSSSSPPCHPSMTTRCVASNCSSR